MTARLVIAGTHSGVGKTTVATGIMAAISARGLRVAPFKVGPDFIDPSYHRLATSRPGRNLDPYLCGPTFVEPLFVHGSAGGDLAVIEGAMGLFDGAKGTEGFSSTAHVAKLLQAPIVLVVDASSMSTSVGALVRGFATHDPELLIAGVILNRVGSELHQEMLVDAVGRVGLPVLGVVRRQPAVTAPSRHLGLVPASEYADNARRVVRALGELVSSACDLDRIVNVARSAPPLCASPWDPSRSTASPSQRSARIAVAAGPAFTFVYEENVELLRARGAEVLRFDPASDEALPEMPNALYIGGGFPETYAEELHANAKMRAAVGAFAASGGPIVAECGGLLYLCRALDGKKMCGVLDADARMTDRLALGYRSAQAGCDSFLVAAGTDVKGHEFHYSVLDPPSSENPAWLIEDRKEGFVRGRVHASYLHLHWARFPELADGIVEAAARQQLEAPEQAGEVQRRRQRKGCTCSSLTASRLRPTGR